MMSAEQKKEAVSVFGKIKLANSLDYVVPWYFKAAEIMKGTSTRAAFVSTNSITQGLQVAPIWGTLKKRFGVQIEFAWQTFVWDSEASDKAHVHVVIVGFSVGAAVAGRPPYPNTVGSAPRADRVKRLFHSDGTITEAKHINGYLMDGPDAFVENRGAALCDVPEMFFGNMPNDGGNFILDEDEKNALLKEEPGLERFVRRFLGAQEFINGGLRYCLWLKDATPNDIRNSKQLMYRVSEVKRLRENSTASATREKALTPHLFFFAPHPEDGNYLLVPSTSSERREYVPMGFYGPNVVSSNANLIIPNASLYHFGVLTSSVHMAWMRVVAGRLEMRYRYSAAIVYNNFPWPDGTSRTGGTGRTAL